MRTVRAASPAPAADERHVDLPLGLVALFWIRAFKPLLASGFPQLPTGNVRLRFVKDGFRALDARSTNDFRVGQQFTGEDAANMVRALRDASHCIRNMPATFTTYPGSPDPVFPCKPGKSVRTSQAARLDDAFLWSFGTFSVPTHLWRAMSRYAPWIEPAILNEWIEIMRSYTANPVSWDDHLTALRWLEPEHDTGIVRDVGTKASPKRVRVVLRVDGTPSEGRVRRRSLLPIRGMAMQRPLEPPSELDDGEPQQG